MSSNWKGPIRGSELTTEFVATLDDGVAGIYLWSRCLPLIPEAILNNERFTNWLNEALRVPLVRAPRMGIKSSKAGGIPKLTIRSNFVTFDALRIGGHSKLSDAKYQSLETFFSTINLRQSLYGSLQQATLLYGPVLYVGETDCIKTRLRDHLAANSDLRERLMETGLSFDSTCFRYSQLESSTKEERTLIEQVLTHLLVAPLTMRAG